VDTARRSRSQSPPGSLPMTMKSSFSTIVFNGSLAWYY
jgi:hypothetical protein